MPPVSPYRPTAKLARPLDDAWRIGDHGPLLHLRTPHRGRIIPGGTNDEMCDETTGPGGSRRWCPDPGAVERCPGAAQAQLRLRPAGDDGLRHCREPIRRKAEGAERR